MKSYWAWQTGDSSNDTCRSFPRKVCRFFQSNCKKIICKKKGCSQRKRSATMRTQPMDLARDPLLLVQSFVAFEKNCQWQIPPIAMLRPIMRKFFDLGKWKDFSGKMKCYMTQTNHKFGVIWTWAALIMLWHSFTLDIRDSVSWQLQIFWRRHWWDLHLIDESDAEPVNLHSCR